MNTSTPFEQFEDFIYGRLQNHVEHTSGLGDSLFNLTEDIIFELSTSEKLYEQARLEKLNDVIADRVDLKEFGPRELLKDATYANDLRDIIAKYDEIIRQTTLTINSEEKNLEIRYIPPIRNANRIIKGYYEFEFNDEMSAVHFRSDSGLNNDVMNQIGSTLSIKEGGVDWDRLPAVMENKDPSYKFFKSDLHQFRTAVKLANEGINGPQNERY